MRQRIEQNGGLAIDQIDEVFRASYCRDLKVSAKAIILAP
jgi:hypothetical protein